MQEAKATADLLLQDFEAHSTDWLWRIDSDGRLAKASQRFVDATGLSHHELEGGSFLALFAPESVHQLQEFLKARKPFRDEILRVTIGSREAWWSMSGQPMADGGWRGVCSDITRSRDAEARIAYVTEYDTLTDLPNRAMLVRQLEMAEEAAKERDESFALFVIDLDNFKQVNDRKGHGIGDQILIECAQRLTAALDGAVLSRIGGDEFACALTFESTKPDAVDRIAGMLIDTIGEPFMIEDQHIEPLD